MNDPEHDQEKRGREILEALLKGDHEPALRMLEASYATSKDPVDRLRFGLARTRLLVSGNRLDEARAMLVRLENDLADAGDGVLAWRAQVALERVVVAARSGDLDEAREALASVPNDLGGVPDEPMTRAVQEVAGLAALRGSPLLEDARKLLDAVHPVNRAGVEANLLLAEGKATRARELLVRELKRLEGQTSFEVRAGLLLQLAVLSILSGRYKQAVSRLKEARTCAVQASDVYLYLAAAALLVISYASLEDRLNAYAVCMRAMVSLEDLLGQDGGRMFREFLGAFRKAWGENAYREVALNYVHLRKTGAIT